MVQEQTNRDREAEGRVHRQVCRNRRHFRVAQRRGDTKTNQGRISERLSTVTIVLVGTETKRRKHIDWEIYSSMYDGPVNKKSGILAICLPSTGGSAVHAPHGDREKELFPDIDDWFSITSRSEYEKKYPHMPPRIIDNLVGSRGKISVVPWGRVANSSNTLGTLIDVVFHGRSQSDYDLSTPMRRRNS